MHERHRHAAAADRAVPGGAGAHRRGDRPRRAAVHPGADRGAAPRIGDASPSASPRRRGRSPPSRSTPRRCRPPSRRWRRTSRGVVATAGRVLRSRCATWCATSPARRPTLCCRPWRRSRASGRWRCDVMPLRERMEAAYLAIVEQAATDHRPRRAVPLPAVALIVSSLLPSYHGELLEVAGLAGGFASRRWRRSATR